MKAPKSWNSSRSPVCLMHLTVTECFLAFPATVFCLSLISFLLITVPFLRGVSTLPRLAVCMFFAKPLTYFLAPFFLLSSHHSCCPLKYHLLLNIPCNSMVPNGSIIQTRQQHCSSQQGKGLKIVNAIGFLCSLGETHERAVLNGVLGES